MVNHAETEFTLDFIYVQPQQPKGKVRGRMIMSPKHAKRFLIALNEAVLDRAERSFPTVLGALDALHLASALLYMESRKTVLVFLTHDLQLGLAAQAVGMATQGLPRA